MDEEDFEVRDAANNIIYESACFNNMIIGNGSWCKRRFGRIRFRHFWISYKQSVSFYRFYSIKGNYFNANIAVAWKT